MAFLFSRFGRGIILVVIGGAVLIYFGWDANHCYRNYLELKAMENKLELDAAIGADVAPGAEAARSVLSRPISSLETLNYQQSVASAVIASIGLLLLIIGVLLVRRFQSRLPKPAATTEVDNPGE